MDSIFIRAYERSNNFEEFWGEVMYLFHAENGLPRDTSYGRVKEWYEIHRNSIWNKDVERKAINRYEELMKNFKGEIPVWDGVSGVEELKIRFRKILKDHRIAMFNKEKEEALSGK